MRFFFIILVVSCVNITGELQPGYSNPHAPGQPIQLNFTVTIQSHDLQVVKDLQMVFACQDMKVKPNQNANCQRDFTPVH